MATNVDERIVSAKFDASDFEKGVNKTIKKLDELKKSLNITQVQKDVKELAEKTEASTDSMGKSLDKLSNRLTTFVGMVKQQILGSLASEVSSIFINMQHSITGFIRSISSDQVSAGMSKYQSMLTSVRQMVNAGFNEDKVFETLERTQTYADETSYSFEQMADAMSKMVAAGVDLEQAGKNVEGIANACANAGINANDASRAFYNLSQAYSSGKLHYTDYRSLELLNLTTEEFKEQMLEAAVAAGTLTKKTDKLGNTVYKTTNKKDKKVRANKTVNKKNLSEMLKYDWMNSEAMNYLFGKEYWMEVIDKDELAKLRKELGDEEFEKRFGKIASQAYNAAYEARSFVDVVNAIKDSVSSGWSKTFQNLFGKLTEAKDFFTDLANGPLAQVVYDIGEYRNAILGYWNELDAEGNGTGGVMFRQSILNIADALGILFKTFQQILPGFDELGEEGDDKQKTLKGLGERLKLATADLKAFTMRIKEAAKNFNEWMNSSITKGGPTRIELLRKAFSNIGKVLTIVGRLAGIVIEGIFKALDTLSPIIDGVLQVFTKLTEPLGQINKDTKAFKDIEHSINNILTIIKPIADFLGKILGFAGEIVGFFAQMALDTVTSNIEFFSDALGLLMELITGKSSQMEKGEGILARIQADFEGIKQACTDGVGAIKEFFTALFDDLRKLFGLTDKESKETEEGNGVFSGIIHFFDTNEFVQSAKAWIKQAFIDIGDYIKSLPSKIKEFGANLYDIIRGMIFTEKTAYNGSTLETKTILTPFGEWLDGVIKDVKAFVISIPQKIIDGVGTVANWIDEIFNKLLGEKPAKDAKKTGKEDTKTDEKMERFDSFISEVTASVKEWFEDLPNKIQKALGNIGNFFSLLWNKIDQLLFGKKVKSVEFYKDNTGKQRARVVTKRIKSGFSKWFDGIIKEISKFIKNIPEYIKAGIKGAGDIISAIVNAIFGKDENEQVDNKTIEDKITAPFLGINLNSVLEKIKDIGITLINQIARIFTGTDDVDKNMEWFSGKVAEGITWVKDKAKEALDKVLEFLVDLPGKIAEVFTGESKDKPEQGKIGKAISDFGAAIGKFLTETLPDNVLKFIDNAVDAFDKIWDKFYKLITGEGDEETNKVTQWAEDEFGYPKSYAHRQVKTGWENFVEKLGNTISHVFEKLPVWVAEGVKIGVDGLNSLISGIGDWIKSVNLQDEAKKLESQIEGSTKTVAESASDAAKKTENEESPLMTAIKGIGSSLFLIITKTIPEAISQAFIWLGNKGSELWDGFSSIFNGELPSEEKKDSLYYIGQKVGSFIKNDLPGYISTVWSEIKSFATDVWNGISSLFTGEIPETERAQSIANIIAGIKKFIVEDLPKAISDLFKHDNDWKKNLQGNDDEYKAAVAAIENQQRQANERLSKDSEKSGFWSFAEKIKNAFLDALSSIGPAILNGLATALDWIGNIATFIIDAISGKKTIEEQVEEVYNNEKPELVEALKRIGESLKNFFLNTIPNFLGSAIGVLAANAGEWLSKLFGAFRDTSERIEKEQEKEASEELTPTQVAESFVSIFTSFFNNELFKMGVDAVKALSIILAIVVVLRTLRDLFSLADEAEAVGDIVKWTALAIAISGLVGILTAVTNLLGSGDAEKVAAAERFIDKIGGLLEKVAWIVGLITVGKLIDNLGTNGGSIAERLLGVVTGPLTGFFTSLAVGAGGSIAGGMISSTLVTMLEDISNSFRDLVFTIDDITSVISPLADKLNAMNEPLVKAIDSVNKIKELFNTFYNAFGSMYSSASGKGMQREPGTNIYTTEDENIVVGETEFGAQIEAFLENLKNRVELFNLLSTFIESITTSLQKFSTIPDVDSELSNMMEMLTGNQFQTFLIKMLNVLKTCLNSSGLSAEQLGVTEYMVGKYTSGLAAGLQILASALSVFSNGISGFTIEEVTAFDKTLDVFSKLAETFKGSTANPGMLERFFKGDTTLSSIGAEIKMFGYQIKVFYDNIKNIQGFEENEISRTQSKVDAVINIAKQFAIATNGLIYYKDSRNFISDLTELLPDYGTALSKFFIELNRGFEFDEGKTLSSDRVSMLVNVTEGFANIISAVNGLATLMKNSYGGMSLSELIDSMFGDTREKQNNLLDANRIGAMILAFDKAIITVMEANDFAESYKTIGSNIASKLAEGIQSAFDTDPDLKIKITPVLNMSDDTKRALRQQLGESFAFNGNELYTNVVGANDQTEADSVKWSDLKASLDSIGTAIAAGPTNAVTVADMVNALTGVKVVIDKDELVGSITSSLDGNLGLLVWNVINNISNGP